MRSLHIIYFFYAMSAGSLYSQSEQSPENLFRDAIYFYQIEDFKEAAFLFRQLLTHDPENANFNFYAGMSFLGIQGSEQLAIPYLEKAVRQTNIKVRQRNYRESRSPHHAWFYLGNAYRINNQLDQALEAYQTFQDIRNFDRHYNLRIVDDEVNATNRAKIIQDSPLNLRKVNLGEPVNTGGTNFNPVLSGDEKTMVYVSSQRFYDAVMHTEKTGNNWGTPVNITSQIGSDGDMFPSSLSANGKDLYLVKRSRSGGDIYVSHYDGNLWSKAKPLNGNINTRFDEAHASVSPDGRYLFISSNRRGGFGGLDIYVSERQADGEWGPALNMGNPINSDQDENTPFLAADGNTLFFSSKGHFNMGGYDIFFSEKNQYGAWNTPVNIGYPINTTGDDKFFFPAGNNQLNGYMALYSDNNRYGNREIFRLEVIPVVEIPQTKVSRFEGNFTIKIQDEESGKLIEIYYDSELDTFRTKDSGEKRISLEIEER